MNPGAWMPVSWPCVTNTSGSLSTVQVAIRSPSDRTTASAYSANLPITERSAQPPASCIHCGRSQWNSVG